LFLVCHVGPIWLTKPFEALARLTRVTGVIPADWFSAFRKRGTLAARDPVDMPVLDVCLPPSWASRTAWLGQRLLWRRIRQHCARRGVSIHAVIVTTPHYLTLLDLLPRGVRTFYYGADNYRAYEGWGEKRMTDLERRVVHRVEHSFFVSHLLAQRAVKEYGVAQARVHVSMNATEDRFFPDEHNECLPAPARSLEKPIVGVIGGIKDRLDYELLLRCIQKTPLGTLLLVGPLPENPPQDLVRLLEEPKCVAVGRQPHAQIHRWFQCLDVGLIPYRENAHSHYCSPMRLFDHLAAGSPVVATTACDQVRRFAHVIDVCDNSDTFVAAVHGYASGEVEDHHRAARLAEARRHTWTQRAEKLLEVMAG